MDKSKRGPGRPRKTRKEDNIPINGVVTVPSNLGADPEEVYDIEIICDSPETFKNSFSFMENMGYPQCVLHFEKTDMYMLGLKTNMNTLIQIHGKNMNSYYCLQPITLTIEISNFINDIIDNFSDNTIIKIILNKVLLQSQQKLGIVLENKEFNVVTHYSLSIKEDETSIDADLKRSQMYIDNTLDCFTSFKLPCKLFKNIFNKIRKVDDICIINSHGPGHLMFTNHIKKNMGNQETIFKNPQKIMLSTQASEENILTVSININNFTGLLKRPMDDDIYVYISNDDSPVIFTLFLARKTDEKTKEPVYDTQKASIYLLVNQHNYV